MYKRFIKRLIDILLAMIGLPFFFLIYIVFAPGIKLYDNGPVFFIGERIGKNGRIFRMYKFRSMKTDAPDIRNDDGSTFNASDDDRVTRLGKFLRSTSIDEVPQILNVLKGDMSIIGPRPDLPEHRAFYKGDEERKLEVRPGITGFSQAYYRNKIPWKERIQNDIFYIDHLSFKFDVQIFFKTISSVFKRKDVYLETAGDKGNRRHGS